MSKELTKESVKYLVSRLLENANEATEESRSDRSDLFAAGRKLAYYEMLDILKSELDVRDQNLKYYGLNVDLERQFI